MDEPYDDVSDAERAVICAYDGLVINPGKWKALLKAAIWLLNNPTDWPGGQSTDRLEQAVRELIPGWRPYFERD
jgi:hypothetical protein